MRWSMRSVNRTNQRATSHDSAFTRAVNAIPEMVAGTERNGPPRTNHQTVMPGCTKPERGSRSADGVTLEDESKAGAAALAAASTTAARNHQRALSLRMDAA